MKVKDLLNELAKLNLEADINVVIEGMSDIPMLLRDGESDDTCKQVYIYGCQEAFNEIAAHTQIGTIKNNV